MADQIDPLQTPADYWHTLCRLKRRGINIPHSIVVRVRDEFMQYLKDRARKDA